MEDAILECTIDIYKKRVLKPTLSELTYGLSLNPPIESVQMKLR